MKPSFICAIAVAALTSACAADTDGKQILRDVRTGAPIGYRDTTTGEYQVGDKTFNASEVTRVEDEETAVARVSQAVMDTPPTTQTTCAGDSLDDCTSGTEYESTGAGSDNPDDVWEYSWDIVQDGYFDVGVMGCVGKQCWFMRERGALAK
jgi:hypothetical protein